LHVSAKNNLRPTVEYCCRQGIHCWSSPGTEADLKTELQDNNKKPNRITSAGTAADSELQPIVSTSRPACSNTFVACRLNFRALIF